MICEILREWYDRTTQLLYFTEDNDYLQNMAPTYWSERRIQYRNICILCDKMDDAISLITMVSFSNNLYFICVQLLRSLK